MTREPPARDAGKPGPFWEQNIALLRSRYPGLAEQIAAEQTEAGTETPDAADATAETEGSGWRIEQSAAGDPTLSYNGIYVHSSRDPFREGKRQAESALAGSEVVSGGASSGEAARRIIVLLGFGLGYTAEALQSLLKNGGVLVIVEKRKELFRLALGARNLAPLFAPGRAVFIAGGGAGAVTGALALLEKARTESGAGKPIIVKNRALTVLTEEDQSFYAEAERRINTWASREEINAATQRRFGKRWTRNLGANLSGVYRFPGVRYLAGLLRDRGIPVFLAAAGPSLDGAAPYLKDIRQRAVVAAVDTSWRFLANRGIVPDFVVSVDPQYWNARHLHRVRPGPALAVSPEGESDGPALIAESAVYPPVLRMEEAGFSRIFLCRSLFPLGRYIEDRTDPKGPLGAGGSVATTAWDFARLLGPEEIWIAGLDLAFPGYRTHFRGALFEEHSHAASGRFVPAETLSVRSLESGVPFYASAAGGGPVLTDRRLSLYAAWFENRFGQERVRNYALAAGPDGVAGSGGLSIPGLVPAPPEQLLALPPRREEINAALAQTYGTLDGDFFSAGAERKKRYGEALESLVRGLGEIRNGAEAGAEAAERGLRRTLDGPAGEKILRVFDGINRMIAESPVKEAAGFLFPPPAETDDSAGTENRDHSDSRNHPDFRDQKDPQGLFDPYKKHLAYSLRFYRSLAEAVEITLKALKPAGDF